MKLFSKKICISIILGTLLMNIIGCSTTNNKKVNEDNSSSKEYSVSGDNLSLDTTISDNEGKVKRIKATPQQLDTKKIKDVFLTNAEKVETDMPEDMGEQYVDAKGNCVNFYNYGVDYYSDFYWNIMNCFELDTKSPNYNADKYSNEKNFKFMTQSEALEYLKKKLNEMGINIGDIEYTVYCLDYKTLKAEEYAEDMNGNEDKSQYKSQWNTNDNCYYFCIRQKCNDIIEYHKFNALRNYDDCNASIQALVSDNGIMALTAQCFLEFKKLNETDKILNPQEILDKVSNTYGRVISEDKYVITSFNLCYMTDVDYDFSVVPIYQCHMKHTYSDGKVSVTQLLINAITGEEVE